MVHFRLASRCLSFYETIEASSSFALDFFLIYAKMTLTQFLAEILFSIANDYSVTLSDLSEMLVKKQIKYFDVPYIGQKVPVLQELFNTRMNNLYVEELDDYVITEMINMFCNE